VKGHAAFLVPPVLLVILSFSVSLFVVPTEREMALMHYKSKQFEIARDLYLELEAKGELEVAVVKPLSELHLQFGDVEAAADLLERFVNHKPENVDARRKLGTFYQYAQRSGAYRQNLETLSELELSEQALRELSHIYSAEARIDEQIHMLALLTEHFPTHARDFLDLAYLEARQGRPRAALDALARLGQVRPEAVDETVKELELNLLLDTGQAKQGYDSATAFVRKHFDHQTLNRFASLLEFKGEPSLARDLIEPYRDRLGPYPPVLAQYAHLLSATGESDRAFELLMDVAATGSVPREVRPVLVELSLARGETALAFDSISAEDLRVLPEWLLAGLVDAAVASGDRAYAVDLLEGLSPVYLEANPLAAAELHTKIGTPVQARDWADRARATELIPSDRLRLAFLYELLGAPGPALDLLEIHDRQTGLTPNERMSLARLFIQLDRAADGAKRLEAYRSDTKTDSGAAWALVASSAGQGVDVVEWLESRSKASIDHSILVDLFFAAEAHRDAPLALASAQRLFVRNPKSREYRLYLARALTRSGRVADALEHTRLLMPGSPDERSAHHEALSAAWRLGIGDRKELSRFLLDRLAATTLDDESKRAVVHELAAIRELDTVVDVLREWTAERPDLWIELYTEMAVAAGDTEALVSFLLELLSQGALSIPGREVAATVLTAHGSDDTSIPYLRELATSRGEHWVYLYDGALERTARTAELERFWLDRSARQDLQPEDKRAAGYRLIELGLAADAAGTFFDLARQGSPSDADVAEYLFLAREHDREGATAWLERRAAGASGSERAQWMRHLTSNDAAERAASLGAAVPLAAMHADVRDAYVEALAASRSPDLSHVVDWTLAREADPERLRRLGRLAFEADALEDADRVFEALLRLSPADPAAERELGLIAFMRSDYERAGFFLARYLDGAPEDYESNYYYGEVLLRWRQLEEARRRYTRALALIDQAEEPGFQERAVRAQLLHRLDRSVEAFEAFERLVGEDPDNAHLRADFISARLEREDFSEAFDLLEASSEVRGPGRVRLDLLDANLLIRTHRPEEALHRLDALRAEHPQNPSVLAARANAAAANGRWLEAVEQFDDAIAIDPRNAELRNAREQTWNLRAPRLGSEWSRRRVGDDQFRDLLTIAGQHRFDKSFQAGLVLRRTVAQVAVPGDGGGQRLVSAQRDHGELSLRLDTDDGAWVSGAFHLMAERQGASIELGRSGAGSETSIEADYRKPYWDVMVGVVDDARRDRLAVSHGRSFNRRIYGTLSGAGHRYGAAGRSGLAQSLSASGALTYTVHLGNPTVSLQYLFDGEYFQDRPPRRTVDGRLLSGIFLTTREVHAPGVITSGAITPHLRADGFVGYSWDRFGGQAPYFGLRMNYDLPKGLLAQAFYERRLYRLDTAQAEAYWGAHVFWRF